MPQWCKMKGWFLAPRLRGKWHINAVSVKRYVKNMVYFQSHTVTLRLWSYVWLGDVIKMNGQCLYLWQKSQVPSWPYDRRLSIPVAGFCGDNKEQRKRISVTGRLVIHSHPGLSTRALKQLGKMKFWEYPWISITVFVLFRTPMNIHSWCGNAVEIYKEPPWFSASSPGPHDQHRSIIVNSGF